MGRQEGVEKENKALDKERFENIKNLYINKNKLTNMARYFVDYFSTVIFVGFSLIHETCI
jgi:hypothetical protein